MIRKLHLALLIALLVAGCEFRQEEVDTVLEEDQTPNLSTDRINTEILRLLEENNRFSWEMTSSEMVSSALTQNDSVITIGYQPENYGDVSTHIHEIDVSQEEWKEALSAIKQAILSTYETLGVDISEEELAWHAHDKLPFVKVKAYQVAIIDELRSMGQVRYAEPATYTFSDPENVDEGNYRTLSSSGCDGSAASSIPDEDYTTVAPGSKISWNLYAHNIPSAWNYSTGEGITVGLIDTGISPDQTNLNSNFASGYSTGRSIDKDGTYVSSIWWWASPDGPDDECGHGTNMAGVLCAPRTSTGNSIGVAYKASLYAIRGTGDVVINSGNEKDGVTDALVQLGDESEVKVISMSIGDVISSSQVADAVQYAYNKGKMLVAAAGTSLTWTSWWGVIFPANMDETVAVTGIQDDGYTRCNTCHDGSEVDFVVTMQRADDTDRTALTLAMSGNQPAYVGGSSDATATTSGIAALIWATDASQTREEVLTRMKEAAEFYPSRDDSFGWGKIDALAAVQ